MTGSFTSLYKLEGNSLISVYYEMIMTAGSANIHVFSYRVQQKFRKKEKRLSLCDETLDLSQQHFLYIMHITVQL